MVDRLTETTGNVDGGLRLSVSELASLKGVTKQAISKRLTRMVEQQLIGTQRRGREITVSLAEWDKVAGEITDPAKLIGAETSAQLRGGGRRIEDETAKNLADPNAKADPTYTQQLTRKAQFEADLKEMELKRQRGELLAIEDVRKAMEYCAELMVRDIDQLANFAEEVAAAVSKSGVPGAREILKAKSRALRERLAASMSLQPETEEEEEPA